MINLIKKIKYFLQFFVISLFLLIFKLLGLKISRLISKKILTFIGPLFRSNVMTKANIDLAFSEKDQNFKEKIINQMWSTYGKILAEYSFINNFKNQKLEKKIEVEGQSELEKIRTSNKPVVFISGHFDNFELMAMHIEKSGIDLATIYRPLNNHFLNPIMENIRKKYICKKQIKKGISGTKDLLKYFKSGTSIALMIDQRVSQGIKSNFFDTEAFTTTIPAQLTKKFNIPIVPIFIERQQSLKFKMKVYEPIHFSDNETIENSLRKIRKNLSHFCWGL